MKHTYALDGTKILRETWGSHTLIPLYDNEDSVCGILYNSEPFYFRKNLQGDIIGIVDKDALPVARYAYDAWGVCTVTQDASDIANINPYRYRGYYYDAGTGMYYLQSRYYDPVVGRFVNGDEAEFLGAGKSAIAYAIYTYCNNNPSCFTDYYGYAPGLWMLTQMHNAVIKSAREYLFSCGIVTSTEVLTCNYRGRYNGRMDIYSFTHGTVWEVKRNNQMGILAGIGQLTRYSFSYVYSLYHQFPQIRKHPEWGWIPVYGSVRISNYMVFYRSFSSFPALILYDYMALDQVARLLFQVCMVNSAVIYYTMCRIRLSWKIKNWVTSLRSKLEDILGNAGKDKQYAQNELVSFLKKASASTLLAVAIVLIFVIGGVLAFA